MIEDGQGNLLQADAEALVNTVNTVGHMGKGIALQFKQAYPENFKAYAQAVRRGEVQPGRMFVVPTGLVDESALHHQLPDEASLARAGRESRTSRRDLVRWSRRSGRLGIRSIAIPPLGCGNGGLDWRTSGRGSFAHSRRCRMFASFSSSREAHRLRPTCRFVRGGRT